MKRLIYIRPRPEGKPIKLPNNLNYSYSFLRKCLLSAKFVQKTLLSTAPTPRIGASISEVVDAVSEELETDLNNICVKYGRGAALGSLFHAYHILYTVLRSISESLVERNIKYRNTSTHVSRLSFVVAYILKTIGNRAPSKTVRLLSRFKGPKKPVRWFNLAPRKPHARVCSYKKKPKITSMRIAPPSYKGRIAGRIHPLARRLIKPKVFSRTIQFSTVNNSLFVFTPLKSFYSPLKQAVPAKRILLPVFGKLTRKPVIKRWRRTVVPPVSPLSRVLANKTRTTPSILAARYADRRSTSRFRLTYGAGARLYLRTRRIRARRVPKHHSQIVPWPLLFRGKGSRYRPRISRWLRRIGLGMRAMVNGSANLFFRRQPALLGQRRSVFGLRWRFTRGRFVLDYRPSRIIRRFAAVLGLRRAQLIKHHFASSHTRSDVKPLKEFAKRASLVFKAKHPSRRRTRPFRRGRLRGKVRQLLGKQRRRRGVRKPKLSKKAVKRRRIWRIRSRAKRLRLRRRRRWASIRYPYWWFRGFLRTGKYRRLYRRRTRRRALAPIRKRLRRWRRRRSLRKRRSSRRLPINVRPARRRRWARRRWMRPSRRRLDRKVRLKFKTAYLFVRRQYWCRGFQQNPPTPLKRRDAVAFAIDSSAINGAFSSHLGTRRNFGTYAARRRRVRWLRKYNPRRPIFKVVRALRVVAPERTLPTIFFKGILFKRMRQRWYSFFKFGKARGQRVKKLYGRRASIVFTRGVASTRYFRVARRRIKPPRGPGLTLSREVFNNAFELRVPHLRTPGLWRNLIVSLNKTTCWERRKRALRWNRKRSVRYGRWRVRRLHLVGSKWTKRHHRRRYLRVKLASTLFHHGRFVKSTAWRGLRRRFAGFWCHSLPATPGLKLNRRAGVVVTPKRSGWLGRIWDLKKRLTKKILRKLKRYRRRQRYMRRAFFTKMWNLYYSGDHTLATAVLVRLHGQWEAAKRKYSWLFFRKERALAARSHHQLASYKQSVRRLLSRRRAKRAARIKRNPRLRLNAKRLIYLPSYKKSYRGHGFITGKGFSYLRRMHKYFQPRFVRQRHSRRRFSIRRHARDWFFPISADPRRFRRFAKNGRRLLKRLVKARNRLNFFRKNARLGFSFKPALAFRRNFRGGFKNKRTAYQPTPKAKFGVSRYNRFKNQGQPKWPSFIPRLWLPARGGYVSRRVKKAGPKFRRMWVKPRRRLGPAFRFRRRRRSRTWVPARRPWRRRRWRRPVRKFNPRGKRLRPNKPRRLPAIRVLHRLRAPACFRNKVFNYLHRCFYLFRYDDREAFHFTRPRLKPRRRRRWRRRRGRQRKKRGIVPFWFWWYKRRKWHRYWKLALKKKRQKSRKLSGKARYNLVGRWKTWRHYRARRLKFSLIRNPSSGFWWRAAKRWPRRRRAMSAAILRMWRALQNKRRTRRVRRIVLLSWYLNAFTGMKKYKGGAEGLNRNFRLWMQCNRRNGFFKNRFYATVHSTETIRTRFIDDKPWGRACRFRFVRTRYTRRAFKHYRSRATNRPANLR